MTAAAAVTRKFAIVTFTLILLCVVLFQYSAKYVYDMKVSNMTSDQQPGSGVTTLTTGPQHSAEVTTGQQQVFLVTRGRSGSSFTSDLIQNHPKVFFYFEPLQKLDDWFRLRSRSQEILDHKNGVIGFNIWGDSKRDEAHARMEEFFTCQLTNVSALDVPAFRTRHHTSTMARCMDDKRKTGWNHLQCYLSMVNECKNKSTVFAKTIKYRIKWTEDLLRSHPNFKVIFLIRDPRAVLRSQSSVWPDWFNFTTDIRPVSTIYCQELKQDILHFQRLAKLFPGRMKTVRYEDGAMDPYQYTRDIYKFLDLEYTNQTEQHIGSLQKVQTKSSLLPAFRVYRADPVGTSRAWRNKTTFETISVIDKNCGELYPLLGYRKIDSQEDLDSNKTVLLRPQW